MSIPLTGWQNGAWNHLVPEFNRLGAMIGLDPNPSAQTLYAAIGKTGSAKLFEQNVASFLEATGMQIEGVASELRHIEGELGLMSTLPFMSLKQGIVDPASFEGVAILTAGTANYIEARIEQIKLAIRAGARITRVVCLASSRVMDGVADKKHPVVADELQRDVHRARGPPRAGSRRHLHQQQRRHAHRCVAEVLGSDAPARADLAQRGPAALEGARGRRHDRLLVDRKLISSPPAGGEGQERFLQRTDSSAEQQAPCASTAPGPSL
jgi:hypothetical protein